jgi:hypothetical protein
MTAPDLPAIFLHRKVNVNLLNGNYMDCTEVIGEILSYHVNSYVVVKNKLDRIFLIPWTSIADIWVASEKKEDYEHKEKPLTEEQEK